LFVSKTTIRETPTRRFLQRRESTFNGTVRWDIVGEMTRRQSDLDVYRMPPG